jgi:hypothetical protein
VNAVDLIDFNRPTLNYTIRDIVVNKTEHFSFYFELNKTTYKFDRNAKTYGPDYPLSLSDECAMYSGVTVVYDVTIPTNTSTDNFILDEAKVCFPVKSVQPKGLTFNGTVWVTDALNSSDFPEGQ